jgi:UDP-N-acetylmuramoylalanine--D-glutamate ligase
MKLADLEHARVAVWGHGREGRAALAALRRRFPQKAVTLFCSEAEAHSLRAEMESPSPSTGSGERAEVRGMHDISLDIPVSAAPPPHPTLSPIASDGGEGMFRIVTTAPDAAVLSQFDVVIKSPGISPYKAPIPEAVAAGVEFTSGTALWFAENPQTRVIGVTGTKGKSTTSAMIAHIARSLGVRTALAGNIGLPLLELLDGDAELWVVELSSFQTGEAGPLDVGVITNLYEEHLDWHGSRERYAADKLKLADVARTLIVNAERPQLLERTATHPRRVLYPDEAGWHLHDGIVYRGKADTAETMFIESVRGRHNWLNALAALTALDATGLLSERCTQYGWTYSDASTPLASFQGLPHRLQTLGERDRVTYINDSISTTPYATLEALRSLSGEDTVVILGGHDRGLDWSEFSIAMKSWIRVRFITQGASGARIAQSLRAAGVSSGLVHETSDLAQAVALARQVTQGSKGTILLSPGAPSFDQFKDYAERGREFARLAGFDPAAIAQIEGLGIA